MIFSLDGTTGTESVYTVFEGHEIMFHVSTLLPFTPDNRQQVCALSNYSNDMINQFTDFWSNVFKHKVAEFSMSTIGAIRLKFLSPLVSWVL